MVPFDLTYVRFPEGDLVGELLALVTLTPVFVMVMYATLIVMRRDLQTVFICCGQVVNVGVNLVLKKLIAQPRPDESGFADGGMPSNHSQFIGFFAALYAQQIWRIRTTLLPLPFKCLYILALFFLAIGVCYSRYYLQYHFLDQIVVGVIIGIGVGSFWHRLYLRFCTASSGSHSCLSHTISRFPLMKWLGIRDYSTIEYAAAEEYIATENATDKKS